MSSHIQVRRGTAAAWTAANPILTAGEAGLETDTGYTKYGDGVTAWVSLAYAKVQVGGLPGSVANSIAVSALFGETFNRAVTGAGHGPAAWGTAGQYFLTGVAQGNSSAGGAIWDPVVYFGYNWTAPAALITAGESAAAWVIEGDYQDAGNNRVMEQYASAITAGTPAGGWSGELRPIAFQYLKNATTPSAFCRTTSLVGNPINLMVPLNGAAGQVTAATLFNNNRLELYGQLAATDTILRLTTATGANSNIYLGQNAVADVFILHTTSSSTLAVTAGATDIAVFNTNGQVTTASHVNVGNSTTGAYITQNGPSGFGNVLFCQRAGATKWSLNNSDTTFNAPQFTPGSASFKGLLVTAAASQTANLFEVQSSTPTTLSGFSKDGHFFTFVSAAPVLADLTDGQLTLWTDASGNLRVTSRVSGALKNATVTVA